VLANTVAGRASIVTLYTKLTTENATKDLAATLFSGSYIFTASCIDFDGDYTPTVSTTHFTVAVAGATGVDRYLAQSKTQNAGFLASQATTNFYSPRNILFFYVPVTNPGSDTFGWAKFNEVVVPLVNSGYSLSYNLVPRGSITENTFTPLPADDDVLAITLSASTIAPVPASHLGAASQSLNQRHVMDGIFHAFFDTLSETKLYPWGFRPSGYSWETHYGENWNQFSEMHHRHNPKRTLGSGVDVFGPRL